MTETVIEHEGVVASKNDGVLTVEIQVHSACGSCHAKKGCMIAESEQKCISVPDKGDHQIGDKVVVFLEERQGFQAVFLGYLCPFVILLISLIIAVQVFKNEVLAGVSAMLILVPYYLALYIFRDKIKKNFTFRLKST